MPAGTSSSTYSSVRAMLGSPAETRAERSLMRPRVLLGDSHALLLEAFQKLLASDCDVVGMASDGRALLDAVDRLHPDIVICDVAMPLVNGLEVATRIRRTRPNARVVLLSMNEDPELAMEALRAGVSAFLLKRSAASELRTAVREVAQDRSYVTSLMTHDLVRSMLRSADTEHGPLTLTPRQRDVVRLVAMGQSMKEVALALRITPRTVAFHKYRLMRLLNVRTTAELIQFAVKHHLV